MSMGGRWGAVPGVRRARQTFVGQASGQVHATISILARVAQPDKTAALAG